MLPVGLAPALTPVSSRRPLLIGLREREPGHPACAVKESHLHLRVPKTRVLSVTPTARGGPAKGPPGRIRTRTDAVLSRVPLLLGYGGLKEKWSCAPGSHRATTVLQTAAFSGSLAPLSLIWKWCPRQESHLRPTPSHGGALDLLSYVDDQKKRLPGMDSHHDNPFNRRACCFDTTGKSTRERNGRWRRDRTGLSGSSNRR